MAVYMKLIAILSYFRDILIDAREGLMLILAVTDCLPQEKRNGFNHAYLTNSPLVWKCMLKVTKIGPSANNVDSFVDQSKFKR